MALQEPPESKHQKQPSSSIAAQDAQSDAAEHLLAVVRLEKAGGELLARSVVESSVMSGM